MKHDGSTNLLSQEEAKIIDRIRKRANGSFPFKRINTTDISYRQQRNFTICLASINGHLLVGVAKRNPTDKTNFKAAQQLAFARALRNGY